MRCNDYQLNGELSHTADLSFFLLATTVFGYTLSNALIKEGNTNPALLGQRAALEWVQQNIAVFGDDPDNVTIS